MGPLVQKGGFVFVVGPSGAGKDSLISFARDGFGENDRIIFPRRIVTRVSSQHEDHDSIGEAAFAEGEASGAFTLCWRAHGLGYAIPKSVRDQVEAGKIAVCNISRRVVPWTRIHLPNVKVVEVTASAEVLAVRLAGRARLEDGDLSARLARSLEVWTPVDVSIVNDRSIDEGGRELVTIISNHAEHCQSEDRLVPRFG